MANNKIVLFGEYLLRLTPPDNLRLKQSSSFNMYWAGSEGNIAISLAQFGKIVQYITSLPANDLARNGMNFLQQFGVGIYNYEREGRVGTYYYETGAGSRPGKVLYDRKYSAFSTLKKGEIEWRHLLNDASWFHWSGITPALDENKIDVLKEALQTARQKGMTVSADFNYRSTLWDYGVHPKAVMPGLLNYCDVVLADVDSFKIYFDQQNVDAGNIDEVLHVIHQHLPQAKYIAVTMRNYISATQNKYIGYLWHNDKVYASKQHDLLEITERIGAGDAFMAGLIYALHSAFKPADAIEFAIAAAAIKHTVIGDANYATVEEVQAVALGDKQGGIIR